MDIQLVELIMRDFLTIILLSCILFTICQCTYKKVIHNTDPEAKCLDGTPGLIFINQGSVKDKFLIYFIGGGYCGQQTLADTLESCYKRSKTNMGSSLYWPDNYDKQVGGILTDDQLYANWTKILVGYCDGAFHQGYTKQPIKYKDTTLYFRGSLVTKSHFKYLFMNYQMDRASKIILSGGSAGGVAAFVWNQYLRSVVNNPQAVYTVPDAGFFPMANTFKDNIPLAPLTLQNIVKVAKQDQPVPIAQCARYFQDDHYKCLIPEFYHPFLKGKFLWINSEYDAWGIDNILQIKCLKQGKSGAGTLQNCTNQQKNYIQYYRNKTVSLANEMKNQGHSFWMIACSLHAFAPWNYTYNVPIITVPQQSDNSVRNAIKQFVLEDQKVWMVDNVSWPNNKPCAY